MTDEERDEFEEAMYARLYGTRCLLLVVNDVDFVCGVEDGVVGLIAWTPEHCADHRFELHWHTPVRPIEDILPWLDKKCETVKQVLINKGRR